MSPENRSPTVADPSTQQEFNSKQGRVRTVYKEPDSAPDGTILNLDCGDGTYCQITRIGNKWLYQALYASIEDIDA